MTDPRTIEQHGSRIITALEQAWAAVQDQHPDVPDVVIVTGAGSNQKGTPEGYRLRGHHWPERWVLGGRPAARPELFIAGELLAAGGRAVVEVMLHEAAHALATGAASRTPAPPATATTTSGSWPWPPRWACAARTCPERSSAGQTAPCTGEAARRLRRRHRRDRQRPAPVPGRPGQPGPPRPAGEAAARTRARTRPASQARRPARRRRVRLPAEPRRIQLTPKQIEDGPVICGVCCAPFEPPEDDQDAR